jgi:glutamyl-tRNA reductase
MHSGLRAVSLSHTHAPVNIRELIYLPEAACKALLIKLQEILAVEEALIFSTCNRTEVYYVAERDLSQEIIKILAIEKGIADPQPYLDYFDIFEEEEAAVRYLFEVSMGLHSQVLGDLQISNQIKQAYRWSNDLNLAGAYLHRLLHTIFHTNKRVQQETPFRDGAASVSYASTALGAELVANFRNPKALVIGLGEMGRDVARNLDGDLFADIYLCNRTRSKAEALALETGAQVLDLEEMPERLGDFDLIISCVSVDSPLIRPGLLQGAHLRTQYLIDLCVPLSIAPEVEALPHVVLFNVDDIHARTQAVLGRRQEAMAGVKRIISEEMKGFLEWRKQLIISPTIHKIKGALEQIRKEEMARFLKNASEEEEQLVENVTRGILNKFMKLPVLQLKDACKRGEQDELIDLIHDLFDLERSRAKAEK